MVLKKRCSLQKEVWSLVAMTFPASGRSFLKKGACFLGDYTGLSVMTWTDGVYQDGMTVHRARSVVTSVSCTGFTVVVGVFSVFLSNFSGLRRRSRLPVFPITVMILECLFWF